jgi:hypothetical protein
MVTAPEAVAVIIVVLGLAEFEPPVSGLLVLGAGVLVSGTGVLVSGLGLALSVPALAEGREPSIDATVTAIEAGGSPGTTVQVILVVPVLASATTAGVVAVGDSEPVDPGEGEDPSGDDDVTAGESVAAGVGDVSAADGVVVPLDVSVGVGVAGVGVAGVGVAGVGVGVSVAGGSVWGHSRLPNTVSTPVGSSDGITRGDFVGTPSFQVREKVCPAVTGADGPSRVTGKAGVAVVPSPSVHAYSTPGSVSAVWARDWTANRLIPAPVSAIAPRHAATAALSPTITIVSKGKLHGPVTQFRPPTLKINGLQPRICCQPPPIMLVPTPYRNRNARFQ